MGATKWPLAVVCTCTLLVLAPTPMAQSLYKCVGAGGRVAYQQNPCPGAGTKLEVSVPSGMGTAPAATPGPASANSPVATDKPKDTVPAAAESSLPSRPPVQARGRLDGWPKSGDGLSEGMSPRDVIGQWGRPHQGDVVDRRGLFFDYCDFRVAFFFDGKLASWVALFPETKAGAHLFIYGEPWKAGPLKWGVERERVGFTNAVSDHGDVQTWAKGRWIVTDSQGNIVSWCDSSGSSMSPPTRRTAWE